jgi:hypothetical protein
MNPWSSARRTRAREHYEAHQALVHRLIDELDAGEGPDPARVVRLRRDISRAEADCTRGMGMDIAAAAAELKSSYRKVYPDDKKGARPWV